MAARDEDRCHPSLPPKSFICFDLGEKIFCNETDRRWFFLHLGTNRAVAPLFAADSLYKHRRWVPTFPLPPSHPHHRLQPGTGAPSVWWRSENSSGRASKNLAENLSVTISSLINLQVVSCGLSSVIIVTARQARSLLACLTPLTPPEQAARLNDKVISANPAWFRAPREIDTYFSLLWCSLKCNIINSTFFFFFSIWRFKAVGHGGRRAGGSPCWWSSSLYSGSLFVLKGRKMTDGSALRICWREKRKQSGSFYYLLVSLDVLNWGFGQTINIQVDCCCLYSLNLRVQCLAQYFLPYICFR